MSEPVWLFGYGSLIWRPDFPYQSCERATLQGFERRFWQGSHDHRGTEDAPGRVVTLVPGLTCVGMAFELASDVVERTLAGLDYREKNGYQRKVVDIELPDRVVQGLVYYADVGNFAWLGPAAEIDIAKQIASSFGPSGSNPDYLYRLAKSLKALDAEDSHVFELERLVRDIRGE